MKKLASSVLLEDLMSEVRQIILEAEKLRHIDREILSTQPSAGKWSVGQVLEHLNFYSRFYLPAIEAKLHRHSTTAKEMFKPGWFGNYFTNMMKPASGTAVVNKMKALKSATPVASVDPLKALEQFISDQHRLLNLLQLSKTADIGKLRVPTSITKMISLKLGDTFRFFIAHEQRHFVQVRNTLAAIRTIPGPSV